MARILFCWELGGGLGHAASIAPLAEGARGNGDEVFFALRDLSKTRSIVRDPGATVLQAPIKTRSTAPSVRAPRTFAHVLHNCGFGDEDELRAMTVAWQGLFDYVRPDLIVFDHSPIALLAARGRVVRRVVMGMGFCYPPDAYPLPDMRTWLPNDGERLQEAEDQVLDRANRVLAARHAEPLGRLSQLYAEVDETFLLTYRELDHYPQRSSAQYWGCWSNIGGVAPKWPEGAGKKIYAYLKPFDGLPRLLSLLRELRCPTLVFASGIDPRVIRRFQCDTLRFEAKPLDLERTAQQCDVAIVHGGHGTTASLLRAGKPLLVLPFHLEQALTGVAVRRMGAGLSARMRRPEEVAVKLMNLLHEPKYAQAAGRFAQRYADREPADQVKRMIRRVAELTGTS